MISPEAFDLTSTVVIGSTTPAAVAFTMMSRRSTIAMGRISGAGALVHEAIPPNPVRTRRSWVGRNGAETAIRASGVMRSPGCLGKVRWQSLCWLRSTDVAR